MNDMKDCCTSGTQHDHARYQHKGEYIQIAGREAYSVGDPASAACILFCTDAFGHRFDPNLRLADTFAQAGFRVVMPDVFKGGALEDDPDFSKILPKIPAWFGANPVPFSLEVGENAAAALKEQHASVIATGYCWGGKIVIHLLKKKLLDLGVVAHPSLLTAEEAKDIPSSAHVLFNCAETDQQFTPELLSVYRDVLTANRVDATFIHYPGTQHGYAVRNIAKEPDLIQKEAEARAQTTAATIEFFKKHSSSSARL
jgi:dienelactone hydrolase